MAKLIYIDTNVYLDYLENRIDKMRPLGEFAYNVFKRTFECEFKIAISDHLIKELEKQLPQARIESLLQQIDSYGKAVLLAKDEKLEITARQIFKERGVHKADVLHALLAKNAGAEYLVTRNMKDFELLFDIVQPILPENL